MILISGYIISVVGVNMTALGREMPFFASISISAFYTFRNRSFVTVKRIYLLHTRSFEARVISM